MIWTVFGNLKSAKQSFFSLLSSIDWPSEPQKLFNICHLLVSTQACPAFDVMTENCALQSSSSQSWESQKQNKQIHPIERQTKQIQFYINLWLCDSYIHDCHVAQAAHRLKTGYACLILYQQRTEYRSHVGCIISVLPEAQDSGKQTCWSFGLWTHEKYFQMP